MHLLVTPPRLRLARAAAAAAAAATLEGERSFEGEDDFPGVGYGATVEGGRRI